MAKTYQQIYREILDAKEANANLTALDASAGETFNDFLQGLINKTMTSIWRVKASVVAFVVWKEQKNDDAFRKEMEYYAKQNKASTLRWYRKITLNYLQGKPLLWNEDLGIFEQVLDPGDDEDLLKIVKYCAWTKTPELLRCKVATDNGGVPGTLQAADATALSAFLALKKHANDEIELVNNTADKLNIEMDAYVDPLVIDLSTGELISEPGVKPVEDAIDDYLLINDNEDFNGRFVRSDFINRLKAASGVDDIDLNVLQRRYAAFPYANVDVSVVPDAGYFTVETLNITYKAKEN